MTTAAALKALVGDATANRMRIGCRCNTVAFSQGTGLRVTATDEAAEDEGDIGIAAAPQHIIIEAGTAEVV